MVEKAGQLLDYLCICWSCGKKDRGKARVGHIVGSTKETPKIKYGVNS